MASAWPQLDADHALRAATFRLVTPSGGFAGTGFLADGEGRLITCHHVAAPHAALRAIDQGGQAWEATPESLDDPILAAADMAIVRLAGPPAAAPLPLVPREPGDAFASRVQLADAKAFRDSTPLTGELLGPSGISYRHNGRDYQVDGRAVSDARVLPGMSGAAVWDPEAGAVVGVLAVSAANDPNLGGFAIPFARALGSARLQALLAANEREVPRYGDRPNPLGLARLLQAASARALDRLEKRGVVRPKEFVTRGGFAEAVQAFLASEHAAMAVVSAAGQGKTSLIADLAARDPPLPAWLVRAADLGRDESPRAGLNRLLHEAGAPQELAWPEMAQNAPALLLVDGLNEAPMAQDRMAREWAPDLMADAEAGGWKVIYTARRELAAALDGRLDAITFQLGRYSSEEAAEAFARYGISARMRTADREPLLLRLSIGGGAGDRRSELLQRFVADLLGRANAVGGHAGKVLDRLSAVAARAARDATGFAPYDDPAFADQDLTDGLCDANLLEETPAGYRFVFDEVADYLHARHIAADLRKGPLGDDALGGLSVNVLALAIEVLVDSRDTESAERTTAGLVARIGGGDYGKAMYAADAIAALSLAPEFAAAKISAARAAVADKLVARSLLAEPGLLSRFPMEGVQHLAYEAILDTEGYGWREKDVYSELHRAGTVSYARMELGIFRLVHELLDDAEIDGAQLLIDWLADRTPLSHHNERGANSEATAGSFSLCMLFAYREIVGLERLFEEVLWAQRPGHDALMQALAEEETDAFAAWLEARDPAAAAGRVAWICGAWRYLLVPLRKRSPQAALARATTAIAPLLALVADADLGRLLSFAVDYHLDLPDMAVLVRRAVAAGALSAHSLAQAVKNGELGLAEALNLGGAQLRSDVIWSLAGNWRLGDARPTLSELVVLLPTVGNWDGDLALHHSDLEHLAWAVDQDSAVESGLCDLFEGRLARPGRDVLAGYLLHPAFAGRWSSPSPGQEAFRTWLAERITPLIAADSGLVAAISRGLADAETYARLRPVAHRLAAVATGDSIVSLCAWEDVADWVGLRDFVAAFLAAAPNADDPDLPFVVTLAARLDATDESRLGPRDLKDMARRHMRKGLS